MTPSASQLMEIHDLREQLEKLASQIAKGPRQIALKQKGLDDKKTELDGKRERLRQLKVAADGKSLQLKSSEAKIYDLQGKLNSVSSNREFDALRTQIAADTMAKSVLEDEILEALDGVDAAQAEIQLFEKDLATIGAELKTFVDSVNQAEPDLRRRMDELEKQIASLEIMLPPDVVPAYRRLVSAYGSRALAPVDGKSCGECFVSLTPQTLVELKSGKLKFCTCGRLMYFVSASAP